jgi:murein DD-endopeptidase MepM/ murein hydrolase activator NlpD
VVGVRTPIRHALPVLAALSAALLGAPALPAAADEPETGAQALAADEASRADAALDRALLLGRVFASPQLAALAVETVAASSGFASALEDIAGPPEDPDPWGATDPENGPPAAGRAPGADPDLGIDLDADAELDEYDLSHLPPDLRGEPEDGEVRPGRILQPTVTGFARQAPSVLEVEGQPRPDGSYTAAGVRQGAPVSDSWRPVEGALNSRAEAGQVRGGQAMVAGGGFVCPTPAVTWFMDDWGFPRSGGRTHKGNDLFAPEGSPVVATASGRVLRINRTDNGLGGLTVSYLTDDGDLMYNAHLHTIPASLAVGDRIASGQLIGTVGRTGNARTTPPHLHFGIYPAGGEPVPPYPYTSVACR